MLFVLTSLIIDHIAESMKSKIITAIVKEKVPLSVLTDESTTLSHQSALIVYLQCSLDHVSYPVSFFLDLIELSDVTSAGILHALLECLFSHGLTQVYLENNWIGMATDGASVMLGSRHWSQK